MAASELVAEGAGAAAWVLVVIGAGVIAVVEGLQAARTRVKTIHRPIHPGLPVSEIKRFIRNLLSELPAQELLPIGVVD